ncbi:MAG: fibronectin type III domain-containing protein [Microgenomates group bacterium]
MKSGKVSVKTVIVMTILGLVGVLSYLGMSTIQTYLSGASAGSEPKSVLATPADDGKSVTITWQTDKAIQAVVEYGTTPASLLLRSLESDSTVSHKVTINPLKPATSYYFRIRVGEEVYDNSGIPFSFKTKPATNMPDPSKPAITVAPSTIPVPTNGNGCSRTVDYNNDGVINSIDFIKCSSKTTPMPTSSVPTSACMGNVDYDKNGVVNSIDRIKCLQNK